MQRVNLVFLAFELADVGRHLHLRLLLLEDFLALHRPVLFVALLETGNLIALLVNFEGDVDSTLLEDGLLVLHELVVAVEVLDERDLLLARLLHQVLRLLETEPLRNRR